jgi:hypothetical protein
MKTYSKAKPSVVNNYVKAVKSANVPAMRDIFSAYPQEAHKELITDTSLLLPQTEAASRAHSDLVVKALTPFPDDDITARIEQAASRTWNTIASDCLDGNEGNPLDRSSVIEGVLDANYLESYGGDLEVTKILRQYCYEDQIEIVAGAFKFAKYCY